MIQEAIVQAFREFGTIRTYAKNDYLFRENDVAGAAFYVNSGLVKISQSSPEGQGITLFLRREGEVFGIAEVLSDLRRQRYARCLTDSEIIALESRKFVELARTHPEFAYSLAVLESRRLLKTQQTVETLISRPVSWRLAWFLVQSGTRIGDAALEIQLQLSHEEISYVIGCSRQTITEILNRWSEKKLIDYTKKKIVVFKSDAFFEDI